jgi:uridylate kinase
MRLFRASARDRIVVSVGGSLIVPDGIDEGFLSSLRSLLLEEGTRGRAFYLVAGGGPPARAYQQAAARIAGTLDPEDADWLGIHATRLNAQLLRTIFADVAQDRVVKNPTRGVSGDDQIIVGGGWRPGRSTDHCAVLAARPLGATKLVNLSNIDCVYAADPKTNPEARSFGTLTWPAYRALTPDAWTPGLSAPFDPVAAREAELLGLEVVFINGHHLDEFRKYLAGEPFTGTVVR